MKWLILVSVVMLSIACGEEKPKAEVKKTYTVPKDKYLNEGEMTFFGARDTSTITFELADTRAEIEKGLMHRKTMPDSVGMLFKFPYPDMRSFWMKNTNIALDIIFVRADFTIENIEEHAQPYSQYSLPSTGPAQYVIEVNAGYSAKRGIGRDTKVEINYK